MPIPKIQNIDIRRAGYVEAGTTRLTHHDRRTCRATSIFIIWLSIMNICDSRYSLASARYGKSHTI